MQLKKYPKKINKFNKPSLINSKSLKKWYLLKNN